MSSVLFRLATSTVKHAKTVLLVWILILIAVLAAMFGLGGKLTNDFTIPGTEGQDGLDVMAERFPELSGTAGQVIFGAPEGESIWDYRQQITSVLEQVKGIKYVTAVADPFDDSIMDPLISANNRYAMSQVQFSFGLDSIDDESVSQLVSIAKQAEDAGLSVHVGGQIMSLTEIPLSPHEAVGVVLALVVLSVAFRSFKTGIVPIVSALFGVGMSMGITMIVAAFVPISTTTPTLAIMLGLAVGIDYALFIVSRHLDQLAAGYTVAESIPRAIATSGAAVLFAGTTVVIALMALFVAGIPFLTVMGLVAALAVAIAAIMAVTGLPALLAVLGDRLRPKQRKLDKTDDEVGVERKRHVSAWWVKTVTSHPWLTILSVSAVVVVMTIPAINLRLALPDNGVEDESTMARQTYDLVASEFGPGANGPLVVIGDIVTSRDPLGLMSDMKSEIERMPGVEQVQLSTPNRSADLGVVVVIPKTGADSIETEQLVHALRDAAPGWEAKYDISNVMVTGSAAVAIDVSEKLYSALVPFGAVVVGLSLIILLIVFRSIWVPIKATLGYVFSVAAAFGMTTWVFIDGVGNDLLRIGQVGPVISFMPIMLMGVLFGLAMDYELFLVSRMAEEYAHTGNARESIRTGFMGSAPVVVAAALIMMSVFSGFIPDGSFYVQPIAFGLLVGVGVDAFLVRMTLVPAVLQLLGDKAWYLPRWLDRMLPLLDVEGTGMDLHFRHVDWQRQYGEVVARAENVSIGDRRGDLVSGAELAVRPGEIIRLTGDPAACKAMLAALGGRLAPHTGSIYVFDISSRDEASRVIARTVFLDDPATQIPPISKPLLLLVNRPLREVEKVRIEENLQAGGALLLGPDNADEFANEQSYEVRAKLAVNA
ncbi:MMPL family transporter [uncultured Actinomyces sp.]|uniref:MMPL family transporter n=1 Tax=uncultured Actinomyces sp. TaxID=249061 RepID=UPI002638BCD9|nr:MMPL family transporter [uncultured Actinomyces sp.]